MSDTEGLRAVIANAIEALEEVAEQLPASEPEPAERPEIQQRTAADVGRQPIGDPPPDNDDDDEEAPDAKPAGPKLRGRRQPIALALPPELIAQVDAHDAQREIA